MTGAEGLSQDRLYIMMYVSVIELRKNSTNNQREAEGAACFIQILVLDSTFSKMQTKRPKNNARYSAMRSRGWAMVAATVLEVPWYLLSLR